MITEERGERVLLACLYIKNQQEETWRDLQEGGERVVWLAKLQWDNGTHLNRNRRHLQESSVSQPLCQNTTHTHTPKKRVAIVTSNYTHTHTHT